MEKEILTMKSKTNLSCKICDRCCKYRGDIKLTPINILEISKFLKWIEFIEEIEPKWNKLSKEKQLKVKEIIFEKYNIKEKFEEQIIENLKEARKLIYEN